MNLKKLQISLGACLVGGILLGTLVHKFAISDRKINEQETISKKQEEKINQQAKKIKEQAKKIKEQAKKIKEERQRNEKNEQLINISNREDDDYEDNDNLRQAYNLPEREWLGDIDGLGISKDEDWYKIQVSPGYQRLIVDLRFTHDYGDIDLKIYDDLGNTIKKATTSNDNEYLDVTLPESGVYYLKVYTHSRGSSGNYYNLMWDDQPQRHRRSRS